MVALQTGREDSAENKNVEHRNRDRWEGEAFEPHCHPKEGRQRSRSAHLVDGAVRTKPELYRMNGHREVQREEYNNAEHDGRCDPRVPVREQRFGAQWEVYHNQALYGEEKQRERRELLHQNEHCEQRLAGKVQLDENTQIDPAVCNVCDAIAHETINRSNQCILIWYYVKINMHFNMYVKSKKLQPHDDSCSDNSNQIKDGHNQIIEAHIFTNSFRCLFRREKS